MTKGRIIFWLVAWILQICLVGVLLPSGWIEDQINKERQMTVNWLGMETLERLVRESDNRFSQAFEETDLVERSYRIIPSSSEVDASQGIEQMGASMWPYVESRIQIFWATVYQGVQRASMLMLWAPYLLPVLIPAVVHGICVREIKKVTYGYASPVRYHAASHALIALLVLPLFYITLPISIHPSAILIWGVVMSFILLMFISNVQKQV